MYTVAQRTLLATSLHNEMVFRPTRLKSQQTSTVPSSEQMDGLQKGWQELREVKKLNTRMKVVAGERLQKCRDE